MTHRQIFPQFAAALRGSIAIPAFLLTALPCWSQTPAPETRQHSETPAKAPETAPSASENAPAPAQSGTQPTSDYPNFSLWPKRPPELIQARRLIQANRRAEAIPLLEKAAGDTGPGGFEAAQLLGNLRLDTLLTPGGSPLQKVYKVRSGDSIIKIASREQTQPDLIMQLNSLADPGRLSIGQELWILPLNFTLVINTKSRIATLMDGDQLLNSWKILAVKDSAPNSSSTTLKSEIASANGSPVTTQSPLFGAAQKALILAERGLKIEAMPQNGAPANPGFFLSSQDVNEISLLMRPGNKVEIIRK